MPAAQMAKTNSISSQSKSRNEIYLFKKFSVSVNGSADGSASQLHFESSGFQHFAAVAMWIRFGPETCDFEISRGLSGCSIPRFRHPRSCIFQSRGNLPTAGLGNHARITVRPHGRDYRGRGGWNAIHS